MAADTMDKKTNSYRGPGNTLKLIRNQEAWLEAEWDSSWPLHMIVMMATLRSWCVGLWQLMHTYTLNTRMYVWYSLSLNKQNRWRVSALGRLGPPWKWGGHGRRVSCSFTWGFSVCVRWDAYHQREGYRGSLGHERDSIIEKVLGVHWVS